MTADQLLRSLGCALLIAAHAVAAQSPRDLLRTCTPERAPRLALELQRSADVGLHECFELIVRAAFEATPAGHGAARAALVESAPWVVGRLHGLPPDALGAAELERAIELLGELGSLDEVALTCELARRIPADEGELEGVHLADRAHASARRALAHLLARAPRGVPRVDDVARRAPPWAALLVIDAFAACDQRAALARLGEALDSERENIAALVRAIGTAAQRELGPHDARTRRAVLQRMHQTDAVGFRESVISAGWLEDHDATGRLLELLESSSQGVAADALWSLKRITGVQFRSDPHQWRAWLDEAEAWRQTRFPSLVDTLEAVDSAASGAALNELLRRGFPRHELAAAIAPRVVRLKGRAFEAVCEGLVQLRSAAALADLRNIDPGQRSSSERAALERALANLTARPAPRN